MSAYIRPRIPGAQIFFTVNIAQRGQDLLVREAGLLRHAVAHTLAARPFTIHAWVVMPDHMHAVWELPEGDTDYSGRWGAIKARFTRGLRDSGRVGFQPNVRPDGSRTVVGWNPTLRNASKLRKGDAGIWQRRFWEHHIRSKQEFRHCVEYCWMNPVKHGFVTDPADWPYSSFHRDMARM